MAENETEARIQLNGSGVSLSGIPLITYKINGSRNTSKQNGVTSLINQFFIDIEIPNGQIHEEYFLMWFGTDFTDLFGEITTPGTNIMGTRFGSEGYMFEKGKVHSFEKVYDRSQHAGKHPYVLKIGIVAERLEFAKVTVDRTGISEKHISDTYSMNRSTPEKDLGAY